MKEMKAYCEENGLPKDRFEKYSSEINNYINVVKPDYISILNLKNNIETVASQNFHLEFDKNKPQTIDEIINCTDENQKEVISKVDSEVYKFAQLHSFLKKKFAFQLIFTASLFEDTPKAYFRDIYAIDKGLILVSITNITHLNGVKNNVTVEVKSFNEIDDELEQELIELNNKLKEIVSPIVKFTKREREILELIAQGKTSEEIAEELSISILTVNTHRQNLLKKFNVKNTTALLNLL